MTKLCDICGREMVLRVDHQHGTPLFWECPGTPDQHKIAELERQLEEAKQEVEICEMAREELEAGQRERAKRGVEIGCEGSIIDGISWLYRRLAELENTKGEAPSWMAAAEFSSHRQKQLEAELLAEAEGVTTIREALASEGINMGSEERGNIQDEVTAIGILGKQRDEALSQLREAQERELALREALKELVDSPTKPWSEAIKAAHKILSNTSATAQQTTQRIEREAVIAFVERLMAQPYDGTPMCNAAGDRYDKLDILEAGDCATILGEKEPG